MHRFLLIDTTHTPTVAVYNGQTFQRQKPDAPRGSEVIVSLISDVLQDGGLTYSDLTAIFVITGPGSFTGTRVGVSVGNALHLARGTPTLGLSWHEAVALSFDCPAQFQVYQKMSKSFVSFQFENGVLQASPLSFEKVPLPIYGDVLEDGEGTFLAIHPSRIFKHFVQDTSLLHHTSLNTPLKPLYAHAPDIHAQSHKSLRRI